MKRIQLIVLFLSLVFLSFSQRSQAISVKWSDSRATNIGGREFLLPVIEEQEYNAYLPNIYYRIPLESNQEINVVNVFTEEASSSEIEYLQYRNADIPTNLPDFKIVNSATNRYAVLNALPYIKVNGVIKRVVTIRYDKGVETDMAFKKSNKSYVANSVLRAGSGDWYKISVDKDGVYKIDYDFLVSLGIDVDNIDPSWINIYGNGDGRLPELNSMPRTDDLAKNAIDIIGDGDGSFDSDDYILFYGWGPDRWYEGSVSFYRDKHIYSNTSVYFININSAETPSRISFQSAPAASNTTVSSYSYFTAHESDLVSLVNGGQRWYGELFDTDLERTFPFQIPNILTSQPVNFEVSLASNASLSSGTAQTYSVSGTQIFSASLPTSAEYGRSVNTMSYNASSSSIPFKISITRNSPSVLTYLDKITLNCRRQLVFMNDQFNFADLNSVGAGNVGAFTVGSFPSTGFVWDVTDRHNPVLMSGTFSGTDYTFLRETDTLRWFVASDGEDFYTPSVVAPVGKLEYQNLHALEQADYIIVTYQGFETHAERLANLHRAEGMSVHVVRIDQIYNEFSSGIQDAGAIRTFMKMFWDRGASAPETRPKYLLLFGDGTYDPKNRVPNSSNFILTYQMLNSESHISAMPSDDFFGMLDDSDAMNSTDQVDIGVGRLLASTQENARELVDKIEHYMKNGSSIYANTGAACGISGSNSTFGDWRTRYVQIADDEEGNYFLNFDVEPQYEYVRDSFPEMNCEKIYTDAYQQTTTAGGERYPDVNEDIDRSMSRGALVINYVGHGGEVGLAEERVLTIPMIQSWNNINNLPLFVSATCEFTKFDDPDRVSAGEWVALNPQGGAVALMTTTRSVFFGTNTQIGREFYKNVFKRNAALEPRTFGEIIMDTKNAVGGDNKRSFTLIGDPALKIALPELKIVTDSINGLDPDLEADTLNALSKVVIKGHIEDQFGNVQNAYNGLLYPTIFDKPKVQMTLSNDGPTASPVRSFMNQTAKAYRGKASIQNGYFEFTCIIPKDIDYSIGHGKLSYYGTNNSDDAIGFDTLFYIGGVDPNGINDDVGPEIDAFMNEETFVDGGLTNESPVLIVKLFDENGINTTGNGIGHDLVAILDGETSKPIVLNDYYSADLDSYQSGEIRYPFSNLEPGQHTLRIKVWDVNNNSSETELIFVVQEKVEMKLEHVLNYPNPFTDQTEFFFEHNQACEVMEVQVQVFTVSGRLVRTINQYVHTTGFRSQGIAWDGKDEFGDQLAKGVYVYRILATTPEGNKAEVLQKLVLLK